MKQKATGSHQMNTKNIFSPKKHKKYIWGICICITPKCYLHPVVQLLKLIKNFFQENRFPNLLPVSKLQQKPNSM